MTSDELFNLTLFVIGWKISMFVHGNHSVIELHQQTQNKHKQIYGKIQTYILTVNTITELAM